MDEDADAFGYQSVHAILRLSPGLVAASAGSAPDCLRAEVQIRSLAQHTWAAASHHLQYKKERGVPKPLRCTIQRVSALLEAIDLELERVLEEREEYVADIATNVDQLVLDIDILRKILRDLSIPHMPTPTSAMLRSWKPCAPPASTMSAPSRR